MKLPGIHCPERVQDTKRKCLFSWDSFESIVTSSSLAQWWVSLPVIQGAGVRLPRGEAMFPVFNCTERESCCFVSLFLLFCFMSNSCMFVYQCVHQASKGLQMGIHGCLLSEEVTLSVAVQNVRIWLWKYSRILQWEFSFVDWGDGDVACAGTALGKLSMVPKFWCILD